MVKVTDRSTAVAAIEHACQTTFAYSVRVTNIVADALETPKNSHTTIFETDGGELLALCHSNETLELGDIKRIIRGMGLEAAYYFPPAGYDNYFIDFGKKAFAASFPGRRITEHDNLSFYESLAPYNPALVKIGKINGEIRGYIPVLEQWYKVVDFNYSKR
ncbi:MAG TPA: hypothetical protein VFT59_05410 [Candidatus Saccharimonadales bacterium]|nr:hypothetical protein [Candidatus Saccharimonadales bacterium]